MSELVSVIVTSYNHAEYLEKRLDSLLVQTYKNIEIIVVDDGSTDESRRVLKKYEKFSNFKSIFLEKNKGYANASNFGVKVSRGKYIMFAEADDFNDIEQIKLLLASAIKTSVGVVYSRSNIVDSEGKVIGDDYRFREVAFRRHCSKDCFIKGEKMQRFLLNSCVIPNMSAVLMKKEIFEKVGGFSEKYKLTADWDFWCRMAKESDFFYITKPLNYFRTHNTTLRSTVRLNVQLGEMFSLLENAFSKMNANFVRKQLFKFNMGTILAHVIICNRVKDARNFVQLIKKGMEYEKFIGLYFVFGLIKKIYVLVYAKLCEKCVKYEYGNIIS
ncbi:MAG: glycosyltransferase [Candidatus Omnitrophota bacterium]